MISRVCIDSRALTEPDALDDRRDAHARIARDYQRFATLQLLNPIDARELAAAIAAADRDVAEIWAHLLKSLGLSRVTMIDRSPEGASTRSHLENSTLIPAFADKIDLVLGGETASRHWDGAPELTTARRFDRSRAMTRADELDREPTYEKGSDRERIWTERWLPLARLSTEVWVCSPYLFANAKNFPEIDYRLGHVTWLLEHLRESLPRTGQTRVTLIGGAPDYDIEDAVLHLRRSIPERTWPGSLVLYTAPWKLPDEGIYGPHDRHIRFSCGAAFDVPSDFDRLRKKKIGEEQGYKCHFIGQGPSLDILKSVEDGVMQRATMKVVHQ